jgi:hypothetical protein
MTTSQQTTMKSAVVRGCPGTVEILSLAARAVARKSGALTTTDSDALPFFSLRKTKMQVAVRPKKMKSTDTT